MTQIRTFFSKLSLTVCSLVVLAVLASMPDSALAQWTTANAAGNINNTNTNNVGVGSTNPNYKLDVANAVDKGQFRFGMGEVDAGGYLFSGGFSQAVLSGGASRNTNWIARSLSASMFELNLGQIVFYANGGLSTGSAFTPTERMRITSGGNVGVNTSNPGILFGGLSGSGRILHISNSGDHAQLFLSSSGAGKLATVTMEVSDATANKRAFQTRFEGSLNAVKSFFMNETNGAVTQDNVLVLKNDGNVGIGNIPTFKLDVSGQVRSSSGGFVFPDGSVQTTAAIGGGGTITGVGAGAGLVGGGTSGATNLDIGAGTGITVASDSISVNYGSTAGTAVQGNTQITVSAGSGISGGGALTLGSGGTVNLDIGAGTGVTVGSDNISVNYGSTAGTAVQGNTQVTVSAGSGMSGGGALTLGSGGTVTLTNSDKGSAQNIFKNVADSGGTNQFSALSNNDAVRFAGTGGTSVSFDASTKKITVDSSGITSSQWINGSGSINYASGNVGIGVANPAAKLDVNGNINVSGTINAKYQDMAEWVPSSEQLVAGTVVVLDSTRSNQVTSSSQSYDTRVAGVISEKPGITLGEGGEGKVLVATTGRVRVRVDASKGPIHIGDLLVTSDIPGMAMKSEAVNLGGVQIHRPGTLIGKALEPLEKGKGEILALLSLQ